MISASARLLSLVSLLSSRPSWTCREPARRLEVTERTVRRDVARLRELGHGVESEPGPWGGCLLRLGTPLRAPSPDGVREALLRRPRELFGDNEDRPPS